MNPLETIKPWLAIEARMPPDHEMARSASLLGYTLANMSGLRVAIRRLRGSKMNTRVGLFNEIGAALQFPWYFGENWGAMEECLCDLSWLPADAYILDIHDAGRVLTDEASDHFATFMKCLDRAGQDWSTPKSLKNKRQRLARPFHTVLRCSPYDVDALSRRIRASDVEFETLPLVL